MKAAMDILGVVLVIEKESRHNLLHLASPGQRFCADRVLVASGEELGSYYYERLGLTFRFVGTMLIKTDRVVILKGFAANIHHAEDNLYLILSNNGVTKEYVANLVNSINSSHPVDVIRFINTRTVSIKPVTITVYGRLGVVCREKGQNPITLFNYGELVRRVVRQSYAPNSSESTEATEAPNNN